MSAPNNEPRERTSKVPREWGRDPWTMLRQAAYRDYAASETFPRWLRATFAAYARMAPNGHAEFAQRELAHLLGSEVDSAWREADRRKVREAIETAIEKGLLCEGSKLLCLVVPRTAVAGGRGEAKAPCRRHPTPLRLTAVREAVS